MRDETLSCGRALIHPGSTPICTHPGMCKTPWVHPGCHSWMAQGCHSHSLEGLRARSSVPAQVHEGAPNPAPGGETHCREVSARFSLMARAMALPPSSCSRLAARLQGQSAQVTQEKLQGHHGAIWVPSWGPWHLLQLPEGAVAPQGMGDGRAALLADGILPEAGKDTGWGGAAKAGLHQLLPSAPFASCSGAETTD